MSALPATSSPRPSVWPGVRSPAPSAALTGLLFLALSAVSLVADPIPGLDLLFAGAWLCAVVPVLRLHALHRGRDGVLGTVGTVALGAGAISNALGLVVRVTGSDVLSRLVLPVGALLLFLGLVALGVATWRARVLPRWCGAAMVALLPLTFLTSIPLPVQGDGAGDYPGVFVVGVFWLALALATRRREDLHVAAGQHQATRPR